MTSDSQWRPIETIPKDGSWFLGERISDERLADLLSNLELSCCFECPFKLDANIDMTAALRELQHLRKWIQQYGRHQQICHEQSKCRCGLTEIMGQLIHARAQ